MVRSEVRRVDGVKYLLVDKPEYMDMAPIQDIVEKALAQSEERRRGKLREPTRLQDSRGAGSFRGLPLQRNHRVEN